MPDLSTADADEIKAWKEEKHLGSPTSILFFTQEQLRLWEEERIIFMADYSTGSRSLLNFYIVSVLHQNKRGIGKSMPDAQKISRDPRDSRVKGNLVGQGVGFPNTFLVLVEYVHNRCDYPGKSYACKSKAVKL